jgi:hypothetical protein
MLGIIIINKIHNRELIIKSSTHSEASGAELEAELLLKPKSSIKKASKVVKKTIKVLKFKKRVIAVLKIVIQKIVITITRIEVIIKEISGKRSLSSKEKQELKDKRVELKKLQPKLA